MFSSDKIYICNSKHGVQFVAGNFHRTRRSGLSRLRLRERGRTCGMKRHVAFNFLHSLVNVTVQHRDGTEAFEHGLAPARYRPCPIPIADKPPTAEYARR